MQIGLEDSFPPKVDYFQGQIGLPSGRVSGYCAQPLSQISHLMGKPQRNQSWVVKPCVLSLNLIMFVMGIDNDKIHYVSLYYHSHNFCHYIFILSTLWDIADSTKSSEKYPEAMSAEENISGRQLKYVFGFLWLHFCRSCDTLWSTQRSALIWVTSIWIQFLCRELAPNRLLCEARLSPDQNPMIKIYQNLIPSGKLT